MARNGKDDHTVSRVSWNFGGIEGYQFAGTDATRIQTFESPLSDRYFPSLRYVLVKPLTMNGKPIDHDGKPLAPDSELCVHAIPMISNFDKGRCKQDKITYKWKYVPDLTDIHNLNGTPPSKLRLWLVNQPDGADVRYWYGITSNPFLVETWSQGVPTIPFIYSSGTPDYLGFLIDNGYDLAVSKIKVEGDPVRYKPFTIDSEESDWYRHGCLLDIEVIKDGKPHIKTFAIYYDIEHKFYAFPVLARNVDIDLAAYQKGVSVNFKYVKTKTVEWPAPIDGAKIGKESGVEQRPDWSFRHDGRRAVCIPLIEDEPWSDITTGIVSKRRFAGGGVKEIKEFYPMLIEIEFAIEVIGDNLEDFTFDLSVVRYIDPQVTGRSIIAAQYAVKDFPDHSVKADDLIILEYEMYMNSLFIDTVEHWPVALYKAEGTLGSVEWFGYTYYGSGDETHVKEPEPSMTMRDIDEQKEFKNGKLVDIEITALLTKVVHYPKGKSLRRPNLITIAKVKNISSEGAPTLFSWVADYSSYQVDILRQHKARLPQSAGLYGPPQYQFIDESKHSEWIDTAIKMNDWFTKDIPEGNDFFSEHQFCDFIYSANIQHIELSTLSFLILSTASCYGNYCNNGIPALTKKAKSESISGALQVFTAFGEEQERQYAGYAGLQSTIETFYDDLFDISGYNRFDLGGTISSRRGASNGDEFVETFNSFDAPSNTTYTREFTIKSCRKTFEQEYYLNDVEYLGFISNIGTVLENYSVEEAPFTAHFTNEHQVNYIESMNQDITINYGLGIDTALLVEEKDVYNCASILNSLYLLDAGGSKVSATMQSAYEETHLESLFVDYNKDTDIVWSPRVFNFFEQSNSIIRPGYIHSRFTITPYIPVLYPYTCKIEEEKLLGKTGFTDYPFAKVYFGRIYYTTFSMMNNIQSQIRTHPNGSYAVFSSNILVPKTKHSMSVIGDTIASSSDSGTIEYDNLFLDKIKMVYYYINKKTVEGVQTITLETYNKETTHIEMMNLAFNKEYTIEDYKFTLDGAVASYGVSAPNTLDYSGGLKIKKKWDSPKLSDDDLFAQDQIYHDKYSGFDVSKVIAPSLYVKTSYPCVMKRYISECGTNGSSFTYFTTPSHSVLIKSNFLQNYITTPRMESIFYFNCPYIEREENSYMLVPRSA